MKEKEEKIKRISIDIELLEEDWKDVLEKAEGHGVSVNGLIEGFLSDLVYGKYSHGGDERDSANAWFDRCMFGRWDDWSFVRYMFSCEGCDEVKEFQWLISHIHTVREYIAESAEEKENIEQGIFEVYDLKTDTNLKWNWERDCDKDGNPYTGREEWEEEIKEYQENMQTYWENYLRLIPEEKRATKTLEDGIKGLTEWVEKNRQFLSDDD